MVLLNIQNNFQSIPRRNLSYIIDRVMFVCSVFSSFMSLSFRSSLSLLTSFSRLEVDREVGYANLWFTSLWSVLYRLNPTLSDEARVSQPFVIFLSSTSGFWTLILGAYVFFSSWHDFFFGSDSPVLGFRTIRSDSLAWLIFFVKSWFRAFIFSSNGFVQRKSLCSSKLISSFALARSSFQNLFLSSSLACSSFLVKSVLCSSTCFYSTINFWVTSSFIFKSWSNILASVLSIVSIDELIRSTSFNLPDMVQVWFWATVD